MWEKSKVIQGTSLTQGRKSKPHLLLRAWMVSHVEKHTAVAVSDLETLARQSFGLRRHDATALESVHLTKR